MTSANPLIRWLTLAALAVVATVEVFPYVWMMATSLKDLASVTQFPPTLVPRPPQWDSYAKAWNSGPFLRYFVNNAVQTVGILVSQLILGCLAAFAFSKLRFPGRDVCFLVVIACLIVPPQVRSCRSISCSATSGSSTPTRPSSCPMPSPRWGRFSSARPLCR